MRLPFCESFLMLKCYYVSIFLTLLPEKFCSLNDKQKVIKDQGALCILCL